MFFENKLIKMTKIKIAVLLIFSILLGEDINAQNEPIHPLPSGALNIQGASQYIAGNSGSPSVSIPIWNLTEGGLSVPVSLNYSTAGVKVGELPSNIGALSWQLNTGGYLAKNIRGKSDFNSTSTGVDFSWVTYNVGDYYKQSTQYADKVSSGTADGEPDVYYYAVGNYSGKFMFDNTGEILMIPNNGVKTTLTQNTTSDGVVELITPEGQTYTFSVIGYRYYNYSSYKNHVCGGLNNTTSQENFQYVLTKVSSTNGNDEIEFIYPEDSRTEEPTAYPYWSSEYSIVFSDGIGNATNIPTYLCTKLGGWDDFTPYDDSEYLKYLHQIKTRNCIVEFERNLDRVATENLPYDVYDVFIEKINIYSHNGTQGSEVLIKSFEIGLTGGNVLTSFTEIADDGEPKNPYKFEYLGTAPSARSIDEKERDYWGYYNGSVSTRNANLESCQLGMLKQVTYPEGAKLNFEYELNQEGGGLRVKQTSVTDDITSTPIVTEFDYANEDNSDDSGYSSSSVFNYQFNYGDTELYNQTGTAYNFSHFQKMQDYNGYSIESSSVSYKCITTFTGGKIEGSRQGKNGKVVSTFYHQEDYMIPIDELPLPHGVDTENEEELKFKRETNQSHFYPGPFEYYHFNYPYDLATASNLNGLPLTTKVYDKAGNLLKETSNSYDSPVLKGVSRGLKVIRQKHPDYHATSNWTRGFYTRLGLYETRYEEMQLISSTTKEYPDLDINNPVVSTTEYTYETEPEYSYLIDELKSTESNGNITKKKFTYPFEISNSLNTALIAKNIFTIPLLTEVKVNDELLSAQKVIFNEYIDNNSQSMYLPSSIQVLEGSTFVPVSHIDEYDLENGLVLQSHSEGGVNNTVLYGYNYSYVIANFINLDFTSLETVLVTLGYTIAEINEVDDSKELTIILKNIHDKVNELYPSAFVTTTIYKPLTGVETITDANGRKIHYEYDNWGRLDVVKDQNRKIIKHLKYNIKTPTTGGGGTEEN